MLKEISKMKIAVASGKGGTGKTTFAVNLAYSLSKEYHDKRVGLFDCDVEAPNDNLFFESDEEGRNDVTLPKPNYDVSKCVACGECVTHCTYNSLAMVKDKVLLFPELCHACGVCSVVCPTGAMVEEASKIGEVAFYKTKHSFDLVYGTLNIGEASAPAVVKEVFKQTSGVDISVIDSAPGTSCPVVAALELSDVAVLVTEPTSFGLNDLRLAVGLASELGIPTGIVINRSCESDYIIEEFAESAGIPILGKIPFSLSYAKSYSSGHLIAEDYPEFADNLIEIYQNICALKNAGEKIEYVETPFLEINAEERENDNGVNSGTKELVEIAVISGKGGTGKTTLSSAFAMLSENILFSDCDVDASNLHLLLNPEVYKSYPFSGGEVFEIVEDKCSNCGLCSEFCHFDAISTKNGQYEISPLKCEGCGGCVVVCPVDGAIISNKVVNGEYYNSYYKDSDLVHARLGIAEDNSGKLVSEVRKQASIIAKRNNRRGIVTDGPPGTSCPVIATITGVDYAVIVTEPTVSGVHDLKRAIDLIKHFSVKGFVVINKATLNSDMVEAIHNLALSENIEVIGEIPFDRTINDALIAGKSIVEYPDSKAAKQVVKIWEELRDRYLN